MSLFLLDANVLIHALRRESADHASCRQWMIEMTGNGDALCLCEPVEIALLRIPTLQKLRLVLMDEVLGFWKDDLWSYPGTRRLSAGPRHASILADFIHELGLHGNDVNDAWLAALAVEHRAILVTTDEGFGRFHGLNWINPAKGK